MTFLLIFVVVTSIIAGLLFLTVYKLGAAIKRQAQKPVKRYFAPAPRPGSFAFISNEGRIVDVFENVVGWKLKIINDRRLFTLGNSKPGFLEERLGVRWIGLYTTIKTFMGWEWSEIQENEVEEDGKSVVKYEIKTRKENVTDFFFQFSHPVKTEAIEIVGNTQVAVTMLITVLNLDPERAQFLNKDPSILLAGMVQSTVKSFICDMEFDQIKRMTGTATKSQVGQVQNQDLWEMLKRLNGLEMGADGAPDYATEDPLGVFGKLGKLMVRAEILQVEAVGAAAAAIEAKRLAELRGDAKIAETKKEAEATVIAATAEADALGKKREARKQWVTDTIVEPIKAGGAAVGDVLEAEQIAASKVTTWLKGGGAVVGIPPTKG